MPFLGKALIKSYLAILLLIINPHIKKKRKEIYKRIENLQLHQSKILKMFDSALNSTPHPYTQDNFSGIWIQESTIL